MMTEAQRLKFDLLATGLRIAPRAESYLRDVVGDRALSPADYASTSGIILRLDDDVWVNAPISRYNSNFVDDSSTPHLLDADENGLSVSGAGLSSRAWYWPPPAYHATAIDGWQLNHLCVSHGDRARLSPIRSCAMTCEFCNIPYDDRFPIDYGIKPEDMLVRAAEIALADPIQPARHLLISGGTPTRAHIPALQSIYERMLSTFPEVAVDIMMVPLPGLFDIERLGSLGLNQISVNIEIFNRDRAQKWMRNKYNQGLDFYLDFIESAATALGAGRVRSMLMVGLEPIEDTLAGVSAIAQRGGVPVLSPFRPDPATPLAQMPPPEAAVLMETYERAVEIAQAAGVALGPDCVPCTHNTLTLSDRDHTSYRHPLPVMA